MNRQYILWFENLGINDVPRVGGKNASLGELVTTLREKGIRVPNGFAVTADGYWDFLEENKLRAPISSALDGLKKGQLTLQEAGHEIRRHILRGKLPGELQDAVRHAYRELCAQCDDQSLDVAVRSSATAEDLPDASFAGQHETYLNIRGEEQVVDACRRCYASLFTDRAISYREQKGFDHMKIALSVGVQRMVRSDLAGAGVMFTLDTDTGFPRVITINGVWGLGENIVQGAVTPDAYAVFKPLLNHPPFKPILEKKLGNKDIKMIYAKGGKTTRNVKTSPEERRSFVLNDAEILELAGWAAAIESHYAKPMDIEWAKDGFTGKIFIVQARPETVFSQRKSRLLSTYKLKEKGEAIIKGLAIGEAIVAGKAQIIKSIKHINKFQDGNILVTGSTDPDWVPLMKKAAGIVTDRGGRTSHAAIVSRELGIPAVVGTKAATETLSDGEEITISCAEGEEGVVYKGRLAFEETDVWTGDLPQTKTQIMLNIASPAAAFQWWRLPCQGIGLARMEFIINDIIKVHPMALIHPEKVTDKNDRRLIEKLTAGYADRTEYFVDNLAAGIAKIAASQHPYPVIVRLSDFKTNEYANLIGGSPFEPKEENPMLGFRGASRYYSDNYREGFALECRALKRAREEIGLDNVVVMVPFCRTLKEADLVLEEMAKNGLKRGEKGLQVYVMCEIPSNVILAGEFADRFDGFSIGSNDLTQLVLGVDRDSAALSGLFDERNDAVKRMIQAVIALAHEKHCKVGICGQAPSDHPDFAEFLVISGIDSISLNPDSVVNVLRRVGHLEETQPVVAPAAPLRPPLWCDPIKTLIVIEPATDVGTGVVRK